MILFIQSYSEKFIATASEKPVSNRVHDRLEVSADLSSGDDSSKFAMRVLNFLSSGSFEIENRGKDRRKLSSKKPDENVLEN
jgi:hypothetical protein